MAVDTMAPFHVICSLVLLSSLSCGLGLRSVVVCGPKLSASGDLTVSEFVTWSLRASGVDVVRWDGSEASSGGLPTCDAAVLCSDGVESLGKLYETFSSSKGGTPNSVVLVAGEQPPQSGVWPFVKPPAGIEDLASRASASGAKRVAVVRHGPLFGGQNDEPALTNGLRRTPELSDDQGRRAARLSPSRRGEFPEAPARRATVGRVAAEALELMVDGAVDFEVRSAVGPEPSDNEWRVTVAEALEASDPRCALRISIKRREIEPVALQDWILATWGPLALRGIKAKYSVKGARPVAFSKPEDERLATLRWEDFDGTDVFTVGTLDFSLDTDRAILVVTRTGDLPLPGELDLMDALADAFPQRFPIQDDDKEIAPPPPPLPLASEAGIPQDQVDESVQPVPSKESLPAPAKKQPRRSSVRHILSSLPICLYTSPRSEHARLRGHRPLPRTTNAIWSRKVIEQLARLHDVVSST